MQTKTRPATRDPQRPTRDRRRRAPGLAAVAAAVMAHANRPTVSELRKLREKNPSAWGAFPDSAARPD